MNTFGEKNYSNIIINTALFCGVLITVVEMIFSIDLYRDSANVYTYMARSLAEGKFDQAFHPGIPFLNVILSTVFTAIGITPLKAMMLVSSLFYIGTIPGVYRMLSEFVPKNWAGIGAIMFGVAPKIIRFYCTGLIDSGKCFFLVWALFFLILLVKSDFHIHRYSWGFFGMLGGLLLSRSEGIGNCVGLVACAFLFWFLSGGSTKKLLTMCCGLPLALALFVSRIVINGLFCQQWIFDYRLSRGLSGIDHFLTSIFENLVPMATTAVNVAPERINKNTWWIFFKQNLRGSYEFYVVLALIGFILMILVKQQKFSWLWPNREPPKWIQWQKIYLIFPITMLINGLIFKISTIFAYRYFLINIPLLLIFTIPCLVWFWQWAKKWRCTLYMAVAGVIIMILQISNGSENFFDRKSYNEYFSGIEIGNILRHDADTARVWFIDSPTEWYHSGLKRAVPVETRIHHPQTFTDFDYFLAKKQGSEAIKIGSRKDLQELPLPENCTVRLFKRINL